MDLLEFVFGLMDLLGVRLDRLPRFLFELLDDMVFRLGDHIFVGIDPQILNIFRLIRETCIFGDHFDFLVLLICGRQLQVIVIWLQFEFGYTEVLLILP